MPSPVIDVHTHCLTEAWFALLQRHGGPRYSVETVAGGMRAIHLDGAPFMTPVPAMFDYDLRIRTMNDVGVDVSVVSLTCPNCYWGGPEVSLEAARIMNDDMAAARTAHPDRLRWFASLPWQYPERALPELDRATAAGASGVMVLANIDGHPLTDAAFAPIWSAIDAKGLPVLVHPTAPPGVDAMDMVRFQLTASIGFTFDTSLAIARMIYDGFFDRYRKLKIIAAHGGGALPYLVSRMDQCFDNIPACREKISVRPSEYVASDPRRRGRLRAGSARPLPQGVRCRQRALRLRLSAHDRRHAGMPEARQRPRRRGAGQGARTQRAARVRAVAASCYRVRRRRGEWLGPPGFVHARGPRHCPAARLGVPWRLGEQPRALRRSRDEASACGRLRV